MIRTRIALVVSTLVLLALMGCSPPAEESSTATEESPRRTYELPYHGAISLAVPEGWRDNVRRPPGAAPPTITFAPEVGEDFGIQITVFWDPGTGTDFNSPTRLQALASEEAEKIANTATEGVLDLREVKGAHATGYVFSATAGQADLGPGQYRNMTTGALAVEDLLLYVRILSNDAGLEQVEGALEVALSAAREEGSSSPADLEQSLILGDDGRVTNRDGRYSVVVPAGWRMRPTSTPQVLIIDSGDQASAFTIVMKPAAPTVLDDVRQLKLSLSTARKEYVELAQEEIQIDGVDGYRVVSRTEVGGVPVVTENFIVKRDEQVAVVVGFESAEENRDRFAEDVKALVESIDWE
ncbi:MAG: hypothetical protein GY716_02530 [bacterium]|nr:hypothetical protein [bacterium]